MQPFTLHIDVFLPNSLLPLILPMNKQPELVVGASDNHNMDSSIHTWGRQDTAAQQPHTMCPGTWQHHQKGASTAIPCFPMKYV